MNTLQSTSVLMIAGAVLVSLATLFQDEMLANAAARVNELAAVMSGADSPDQIENDGSLDAPERVFLPDEEVENVIPPPALVDSNFQIDDEQQNDFEVEQESDSNEQDNQQNSNFSNQTASIQKDKRPDVVETPVADPPPERDPDDIRPPIAGGPAVLPEDAPTEDNLPEDDATDKDDGSDEEIANGDDPDDDTSPEVPSEKELVFSQDPNQNSDSVDSDGQSTDPETAPVLQDGGIPPGFINIPGVGVVDSETFLEALTLATASQAANGQNQNGLNPFGANQNPNGIGNQNADNQEDDSRDFLQPILVDPSESSPTTRERPKAEDIIDALTAPQAGKRVKEIIDVIEGESRRRTVTYTDNSFEEVEVFQPKTGPGKRTQRVGKIARQWIDADQNQHTRRTFQEQTQELARAQFDSQSFEILAMTVTPSSRMDELFQTSDEFRGGRIAATTQQAVFTDDDDTNTSTQPSMIDSLYWTRINNTERAVTERGPGFGRSPDRMIFRNFIAAVKATSSQIAKNNKQSSKSRPKPQIDDIPLLDSSQFENLGGFFSKD